MEALQVALEDELTIPEKDTTTATAAAKSETTGTGTGTDTSGSLSKPDCRVQVVCEWITHGTKALMWWPQQNMGYKEVSREDVRNYRAPGPRYHGPETNVSAAMGLLARSAC